MATPAELQAARTGLALRNAGGWVSDLAELLGFGLAAGTGQALDLGTYPTRRALNYAGNVAAGATGGQTTPWENRRPFESAVLSMGAPQIAYDMGLVPLPVASAAPVPAAAGQAPAGAAAPTFNSMVDPAILEAMLGEPNSMNLAAGATVTPMGNAAAPMGAASPAVAQVLGQIATDPVYAAQVPVAGPQTINPVQCTSGVCRPSIQAGNFYANASQSGIARDPNFKGRTEWDRYIDTLIDNDVGGRQAILANDAARRTDSLLQLRQTPQYAAEFAAALVNANGDPAAAQALADARFRSASQDPSSLLALTENNTLPNLDVAMSRQAASALATGQSQIPNRTSAAAAEAGYYGPGILPYGTGPGQPAYLAAGQGGDSAVLTGAPNLPEFYAFPTMAQAGGVQGMLGRADASAQGRQAALSSNSLADMLRLVEAEARVAAMSPERQALAAQQEQAARLSRGGNDMNTLMLMLQAAQGQQAQQ